MANYKYISDSCIIAAARLAIRNGNAETFDSKGEKIVFEFDNEYSKMGVCISRKNSRCYAQTFSELLRNSITSDKCRIHYFNTETGENVYVLPYETIFINNPASKFFGCLIDRNTGYIIAKPEPLF